MNYRLLLAALLVAIAAVMTPAARADDPRIDSNGRLRATWPKDRLFDHHHMRLELTIPDMAKPYLEGVETLTVSSVGGTRDRISLDCDGPRVGLVSLGGASCDFEQAGKRLNIRLPRPLPWGSKADLKIQYTLDFAKARGEGLTWSKGKPDTDSPTTQFPQIHAQGQAELNSRWFPCLDHPSEKLTTELLVTVEDGYEVVSNGRLVSRKPTDEPARTVWHWSQDKPHTAYLVTLVVGKLAVVEVGGPDSARPGLPMSVYTPIGTEENVKTTFANTADMVACFEERFGVKYPWDKYAQCLVRDFKAGGMENTSCTLLMASTSGPIPGGMQDDLISHELAHQWFGDLVTCRSWDHLWINEGWATYAEALWQEYKGAKASPERARSAYHRAVLGFARGQRAGNEGSAPADPAMVSNRFTDPDSVFQKADDPYGKGGMVLHMLRERVGDEAFFNGTRLFLKRFAYKTAETDDFRRVMEEVSGQSLERFFGQWCLRPGLPRLAVSQEWDEAASTLTISVEQTQTVDALNPAYAVSIPVLIKVGEDETRWAYIDMETKAASTSVKLPGKPVQVSVDPNLTILAAVKVEKPLAMWLDEAVNGVTLAARYDAVQHLCGVKHAAAQSLLARIAADEGVDPLLRDAAARAVASAK
jgi:aminopeptidase N